jgi:hypothetical protein
MVSVTAHDIGPVSVREFAAATGYRAPSRAQLATLRNLVLRAHPELSTGAPPDELAAEDEFLRAFWRQGRFFRIPLSEQKRSFSAIFDDANLKLSERGFAEVDSRTFLAACLAAADVEVRMSDRGIGQLLEIGLNPFHGRPCDNRRWQATAAGAADLPGPMPPRAERACLREVPQPSFWQGGESGFRQLAPSANMWSRSS